MDSQEGQEYFKAMNFCLAFAQASRDLMLRRIKEIVTKETQAKMLEEVNIHHNYAALENHFGKNVLVHRKGATKDGLTGIIPGSMGTSSYIIEGLGNEESFKSC